MNELQNLISWIAEHRPARIAVLTGAGISAESGIPTFRGAGGLWENHRAEELATAAAFSRDPELVWRWYEWRRGLIRDAEPNAAHLALAELEQNIGDRGSVTIVTQNVDGLHRRAGSKNMIEIHGNIFRLRCVKERTERDVFEPLTDLPPRCECGALLRPGVVWFGESLPDGAYERSAAVVAAADLLLVVGTSGVVYPAAGLSAYLRHGASAEINIDSSVVSDSISFTVHLPASDAVPQIAKAILEARA